MTGVEVSGLSLDTAGTQRRLRNIDIVAEPGELVAVIGASGTGKSTLLAVLAGLLRPTAGTGTVAGIDVGTPATHRAERIGGGRIGYVPQDEALHAELTVGQELGFAAELRAVGPEPARSQRVREVLAALGIATLQDRRIGHLSGGERKRVSVAVELLAAPDVLLLDEATTGLDPGHERDLTRSLRTLADAGCAIVVATHSVVYLTQYDRVLVLGTGGRPLYWGTPAGALSAAGTASFVDLFDLDDPLVSAPAPPPKANPDRSHLRAAGTRSSSVPILVRRQLSRLLADRRTLWFLALQPPILGLMVRAMAGPDGMGIGATAINLYARRLDLTLVLCAVWLGSTFAVREIVRDRPVLRRERVAGVWPGQVLLARSIVLWGATGIQVVVLAGVALGGVDAAVPLAVPRIVLSVWLCAGAAGCVALGISALVRSTDQALAILPLVLVPQLVLSGGVLALSDIPTLRPISYLSTARWGLSAVASSTHLREVETRTLVPVPLSKSELRISRHEDADAGWDPTGLAWSGDLLALLVLAAAGTGATAAGLRRV